MLMQSHEPIDIRQRDAESGRLLRAYTAEYRRAKRLRSARFTVSGLLAVAGPLASVWSLNAAGLVGAGAGLWVLVTRLVLIPAERSGVDRAVRMQELFDTRLFDLAWPASLTGKEPSEEDISDASRRLQDDECVRKQHDEGWYPSTEGLPWPVDVLVAQWSSAAYARRQHFAYFWFLAMSNVGVITGVIMFGAVASMTLTEWLITFLLPGLPAILDAGELTEAHRRLAEAKNSIERRIAALWRTELESPGTLSGDQCRSVQDEAFKLRVNGLQIPEWFYWLHRDRNEANMHDAAAIRRRQYQEAAGG